MVTLARFDFGNITVPPAAGYQKIERVYASPRLLWLTELRHVWRPAVAESPWRDFVAGERGEFRVGLPAGDYTVRLHFFDPVEAHGPFELRVDSLPARAAVGAGGGHLRRDELRVSAHERLTHTFTVSHSGGALALHFAAPAGHAFMCNAMELEGPADAAFTVLFPDAPPDTFPSVDEVRRDGRDDPRAALHAVNAWLLDRRKPNGFVGDYEGAMELWYTAAYPIRTFLAAYQLFGDRTALEAAVLLLDRLVEEQMPEGSFTQAYRGRPTASLDAEELAAVRRRYWMNLADIGSVVAALACACPAVDAPRRERYLAAIRRYLDGWAARFRQPNGGYKNGWVTHWSDDGYAKKIYTVATGTTALTLALFARLTGEAAPLALAEESLAFMLDGWHEDGRPYTWAHDRQCPEGPHHQDVLEFGDLFYLHDAVIGVSRLSGNATLRDRAYAAARRHLFGRHGLLAARRQSWWPVLDAWTASKSAALPMVLQDYLRLGHACGAPAAELAVVADALEIARRFLCTPAFSRRLGVMLEDPTDVPFEPHGVQSWAGCAVAATGFAGLALAELVEPGVTLGRLG